MWKIVTVWSYVSGRYSQVDCLLTNFRNRFTSLQRSAPEYANMLQSAMKDEILGLKKRRWIGNLLLEMPPYMINEIGLVRKFSSYMVAVQPNMVVHP